MKTVIMLLAFATGVGATYFLVRRAARRRTLVRQVGGMTARLQDVGALVGRGARTAWKRAA